MPGPNYRSTGDTGAELKARRELAAATERIGDGSQLTPEDFAQMNVAERTALYLAHRDVYEALRDGRMPGQAWRPATHGATPAPVAEQQPADI